MSNGSRLCTQCGLCCTGALHDTVIVRPDEVDAVRSLGFDVFEREGTSRFRLPCQRLCGTECSIYNQRPGSCRRYKCRLLRSVEAGESSLEQAHKVVETQLALIDKVLKLMPAGSSFPEARALVQDNVPGTLPNPELMLHIIAAMRFIDQNFRHKDEGPLLWEEQMVPTRDKEME